MTFQKLPKEKKQKVLKTRNTDFLKKKKKVRVDN